MLGGDSQHNGRRSTTAELTSDPPFATVLLHDVSPLLLTSIPHRKAEARLLRAPAGSQIILPSDGGCFFAVGRSSSLKRTRPPQSAHGRTPRRAMASG